ncbi:response regulator [Flavobacterium sp. 14A]|uniref:response regulator n=1 Tax=Flavobacterium sp. 14A TaxID=2735896 RepID=UPI001570867B|nr:response regulator [Flavobacterium sp. 14A]NRT10786.1 CheY-like chemotaxis protein [Flavobacterium sp. 14A]
MSQKKIWVVDDDRIYKTIIKKIIDKSAMFSDTTTFSNGKEAISALKDAISNKDILPDIVLLDIEMPVMDGWGFMEEFALIKENIPPRLIIYISSSSIAIEDKLKAKNNPNIVGYMSKPITIDDLKLIADFN